MLKLKYILLLVTIIILIITGLVVSLDISPAWYILPGLIIMFFTILGSFRIDMSFYFDVICKIKSEDRIILTFDDGPDKIITPKLLEVLKKNNVKAAFFVIGWKTEMYPELVKKAYDDGHIIGNHSYCHKNSYGFYTSGKLVADIEKSGETIKKILGVKPVFFRPPFGVTNPNMESALKKLKLIPVGWSLRSLDTVNNHREKLAEKLSKVKPGDIVLFHDRVEGIDLIVDDFIKAARLKKIEFAGLDEALKTKAYV